MLALGSVAVLLATFLAGVVGFAYGLIALPLLLVVGVPLPVVIVVNLLIGLVTRLGVVVRLHRRIDVPLTALLILGSLPGMAAGLLVRQSVPRSAIELAAGVLTIATVAALSLLPPRSSSRSTFPGAALVVGGLGGLLGVTTSLNGVPPALLLMRERVGPRAMVANMGAYFVVANTLTLLLLAGGETHELRAAWPLIAIWLPVGILGQALGVAIGGHLPQRVFHRLVLMIAVVSGIASVVHAL